MLLNKIKLLKNKNKLYIYFIYIIKNIKIYSILILLYYIILNKNKNIFNYLKVNILKLIFIKKKYIYKNKKLWRFINFIIYYKIDKSKYFLEYKIKDKIGGLFLSNNLLEGKQKYKNFISCNDLFNYSNKFSLFKSFNIPNNILKKKLIKKKYWFLWKFKEVKVLRYSKILIWPLLITIKPNIIIIKNIYFLNYMILTKKNKKIKQKNLLFPDNYKQLGLIIWYIINKYIYLYYSNNIYINNIIKKYNMYLLEKKIYLIKTNYIKGFFDKKYFFKMQAIYLKLRKNNYLGKLFFSKIYNLYFFWFLFFYNKLYYYNNQILFIIWLRFYYFKIKIINNNFFLFTALYKRLKIVFNKYFLEHNYLFIINSYNNNNISKYNNIKFIILLSYLKSNILLFYKIYFKFLFKYNYKNELNIFDLYLIDDYYQFKDYYKNNYFLKVKNIVEHKHLNFLPNYRNIIFLI